MIPSVKLFCNVLSFEEEEQLFNRNRVMALKGFSKPSTICTLILFRMKRLVCTSYPVGSLQHPSIQWLVVGKKTLPMYTLVA